MASNSGDAQEPAAPPAPTFPIVDALVAFEAWSRDEGPRPRQLLGDAVGAVVEAVGAAGGYLVVSAPPLPSVELGRGTLDVGAPPSDHGSAIRRDLASSDGTALGTLWIAGSPRSAELAGSALELALESAWARAVVRQTAQRLAALDEATRAIAEVLDVETVLQLIADRVRDLVGSRYAALGIVDDNGRIERFITSGLTPDERARIGPPPRGHGLLGLIIRKGRTYRIPDIGAHPDSSGFPANHPPMQSLLGVPIRVKGRVVGDLYLTDKIGAAEFTVADQELVETFALHAGVAMENARLHEQSQRFVVVEERDRISKDLHDGIIQSIYGVSLSLEDVPDLMTDDPAEATARVDRAIDSLNLVIRDIRSFILGLQSELFGGTDLIAGLWALAEEFRLNTALDVAVDVDASSGEALAVSPADCVQLLQMTREALSNAARHSGAERASIRLATEAGEAVLMIADEGVGFDAEAVVGTGHLGIRNLRERARTMRATLSVDSSPGDGARIIIRVPLDEQSAVSG